MRLEDLMTVVTYIRCVNMQPSKIEIIRRRQSASFALVNKDHTNLNDFLSESIVFILRELVELLEKQDHITIRYAFSASGFENRDVGDEEYSHFAEVEHLVRIYSENRIINRSENLCLICGEVGKNIKEEVRRYYREKNFYWLKVDELTVYIDEYDDKLD